MRAVDLGGFWADATRLLPPYTTLDPDDLARRSTAAQTTVRRYRRHSSRAPKRAIAMTVADATALVCTMHGRVPLAPAGDYGEFVIAVPLLTLREALANHHPTDLGITMFMSIRLLRMGRRPQGSATFYPLRRDDYGHMRCPRISLAHARRAPPCPMRLPLPE